jgi:hypothetical protein
MEDYKGGKMVIKIFQGANESVSKLVKDNGM